MRTRIGKTLRSGGEEFITCEEVITFLLDYLSRELAADEQSNFERHLALCPSCTAYVRTYEETVHLGRETLRRELETDLPELDSDLVRAIVQARGGG